LRKAVTVKSEQSIYYSIECFDDYFLVEKTSVNQNVICQLNVFVPDMRSEMVIQRMVK
jgi:hypothetical protein